MGGVGGCGRVGMWKGVGGCGRMWKNILCVTILFDHECISNNTNVVISGY